MKSMPTDYYSPSNETAKVFSTSRVVYIFIHFSAANIIINI